MPGKLEMETPSLVRQALAASGFCWVSVRSNSMAPELRAGDRVRIEPFRRPPMPGDVLLCESFRGMVIHRLLYTTYRKGRFWIRTKGDAAPGADALVPLAAVIGRAARVRHEGEEREVGRRGGIVGAAVTSGRLYARSRLRKLLTPATWREQRSLAGYPLLVHADRAFDPQLLAMWLRRGALETNARPLRLRLDTSLNHDDPLTVRHDPRGGRVFTSSFILEMEGTGFTLRVAPSAGARSHPCPNSLENGLRALLAELCNRDDTCMMLHAAAVALDGHSGAWIAPGASGTGKTTLCRILHSEGSLVLGDDLILVRNGEDGPVVEGSPFSGDGIDIPKTPGRFPLRGWLILQKSGAHELAPITPGRVVAAVGGSLQGQGLDTGEVLDRATVLSGLTPGWRLRFARAGGLRQYMEKAFRDGNTAAE